MGGVYLVKGGDPILRDREAARLLEELVGDEDRTLLVEEYTVPAKAGAGGAGADDEAPAEDVAGAGPIVTAVVNAAQSPPFMTSKRIVVIRDYEALPADSVAPIVTVLGDLLDTTEVVFVAGAGGRVVKALADALAGANVRGGASEKLTDVLQRELDRAGLTLRGDAARVVIAHLGDDAGRIAALVDLWSSTFGARRGPRARRRDAVPERRRCGAAVRAHEPHRRGRRRRRARDPAPAAHRDEPHPAQADASAPGARDPRRPLPQARPARHGLGEHRRRRPPIWGGKSSYPAKKALEATRALGPDGLVRAFAELHRGRRRHQGGDGTSRGCRARDHGGETRQPPPRGRAAIQRRRCPRGAARR